MVRCDYAIDCSECFMVPCPHNHPDGGEESEEEEDVSELDECGELL